MQGEEEISQQRTGWITGVLLTTSSALASIDLDVKAGKSFELRCSVI